MAAGKCNKCGHTWTQYQNGGHHCPANIQIPEEVWKHVEKTSLECKKAWGMGFPVISITLLKQILKRQEVDKPKRSITNE